MYGVQVQLKAAPGTCGGTTLTDASGMSSSINNSGSLSISLGAVFCSGFDFLAVGAWPGKPSLHTLTIIGSKIVNPHTNLGPTLSTYSAVPKTRPFPKEEVLSRQTRTRCARVQTRS